MRQFKILIAVALLIATLVILVMMLFNPQPLQIILETGQAVITQNPNYFTTGTVIILVLCTFVMGASITFLFYNTEKNPKQPGSISSKTPEHYTTLLPLLRADERKAVHIIIDKKGEILQNELVLKLGFSKVKTTRILASLERKGIIDKQRHGLTNSIRLK
ncbi:hypothetical protein C4573_04170 [Candidatus Woesearchaeota archaeon]|nr:MAG: hypothetical protein C4573_04170 [Candidatus Woesearchaeota archaeon]